MSAAAPFRLSDQRANARTDAPRQLLCREAGVLPCAPARRGEQRDRHRCGAHLPAPLRAGARSASPSPGVAPRKDLPRLMCRAAIRDRLAAVRPTAARHARRLSSLDRYRDCWQCRTRPVGGGARSAPRLFENEASRRCSNTHAHTRGSPVAGVVRCAVGVTRYCAAEFRAAGGVVRGHGTCALPRWGRRAAGAGAAPAPAPDRVPPADPRGRPLMNLGMLLYHLTRGDWSIDDGSALSGLASAHSPPTPPLRC